jgi:hypothetical protein
LDVGDTKVTEAVHGLPIHLDAEKMRLVCGSCSWFSVGYKGITCQKTRKVLLDTPACVEYKAGVKDPWAIFKADKYLIELRKDLMSVLETKVFDTYVTEITKYNVHLNELNFALGQHQSSFALQKALQTLVGYRYRVSEIFTTVITYKKDLEKFIEKTYIWLASTYPEVREAKNEKAKQVALYRAIPELIEIENLIEKTMDVAKYVDGKLDSNDRTIQLMLKSVGSTYFSPSKAHA